MRTPKKFLIILFTNNEIYRITIHPVLKMPVPMMASTYCTGMCRLVQVVFELVWLGLLVFVKCIVTYLQARQLTFIVERAIKGIHWQEPA